MATSGTTSTVEALTIALLIVMAVLAAVVIVQSRASSLLGWAVEAGAIALLLPWLTGLWPAAGTLLLAARSSCGLRSVFVKSPHWARP